MQWGNTVDPRLESEMTNLQHPDMLHLQAALGWLELGNHLEANEELEKITANLRAHPDVREGTLADLCQGWEMGRAFEIARTLVGIVPEFPFGWIYQAEAVRRMLGKGAKKAWTVLLPSGR
jgi:hypothetical protein